MQNEGKYSRLAALAELGNSTHLGASGAMPLVYLEALTDKKTYAWLIESGTVEESEDMFNQAIRTLTIDGWRRVMFAMAVTDLTDPIEGLGKMLEHAINSEPTGKRRNALCDMNIILMQIAQEPHAAQ